jgi:uncharacterized membrane protein
MRLGRSHAACLRLAVILSAALPMAAPALAHEKHAPPVAAPRGAPLESVGAALDTMRPDSTRASLPAPEPEGPYVMPPLVTALLEHPHNKIVHFPIVLALLATVLLWLPRGGADTCRIARLSIVAAALAAVAAYFTGQSQAEAFAGEPKEWVMRLHRAWGIATALALIAWAALAASHRPDRLLAWCGLAVSILIGIVAFLGGVVAHGH